MSAAVAAILEGMPEPRDLRMHEHDGRCVITAGRVVLFEYAAGDVVMRNIALAALRQLGFRGQGFVKVAGGVQPGESPVMSSSWRARRGSWALRRVSSVYLVTPCMRNRVMTRLVRADITCGAFPVRMRDLSSRQITSRSQCRSSTVPSPRTQ